MVKRETAIFDAVNRIEGLLVSEIKRLDDLREADIKRVDTKFEDADTKYQIQFSAAKEALGIALVAQEKSTAQALDGTKEAIIKNDANTDKRFDLLSEKIDSIASTMSKNTGAQGIYVTHSDLQQSLDRLQTNIELTLKPVVAFMNSNQGKSAGLNAGWMYLIGGISIIGMIISILVAITN